MSTNSDPDTHGPPSPDGTPRPTPPSPSRPVRPRELDRVAPNAELDAPADLAEGSTANELAPKLTAPHVIANDPVVFEIVPEDPAPTRPSRPSSPSSSSNPSTPAPADPINPATPSLPRANDTTAESDPPCPCEVCGYDLRGSRGRPACPECGTPIPRTRKIPMARGEQMQMRADVVRIWNSLAFLSLVPIALLSPVPCLPCFGIVAAVALATAPGFRLAAIRNLDILPGSLRDGVRRERARFKQTQLIEGSVALLICVYAALATFAWIPAKFIMLYRALILAWWCIACAGLVAQLAYAEALRNRADAADPESAQQAAKAKRTIRVAFAIAVTAAFISFGAGIASGTVSYGLSIAAAVLLAVASAVFILAAFVVRSHAEATGEALYSSPALAKAVATKTIVESDERPPSLPPDWKPPPPPSPKTPEDDEPIPLA